MCNTTTSGGRHWHSHPMAGEATSHQDGNLMGPGPALSKRWGESSPSGGEGQLEATRTPKKTPGKSRGCQEEVKSWEGTRSRAWESEGTPREGLGGHPPPRRSPVGLSGHEAPNRAGLQRLHRLQTGVQKMRDAQAWRRERGGDVRDPLAHQPSQD